MKKTVFTLALIALLLSSCQQKEKMKNSNPFLTTWDTPFELPPFEQINPEHYLPAMEAAIKEHNKEIAQILNNTDEPNFENTILPYDKSGDLLYKVSSVFFNLNSANTNSQMQELATSIAPMVSTHADEIRLNDTLFQKIKAVYDKRNESGLDNSQIRAVQKHYDSFVRNGANLNAADKEELKKINEQITNLTVTFGQNLLNETNNSFTLKITDEADLAGLPESVSDAALEAGKEAGLENTWLFTLHKPSWIPFLQYAEKRELREQIYRGYFMRGDNNNQFDNKDVLKQIVELRIKKAEILGSENYASYVIDDNMAKTPENVYNFLDKVWEPALKLAKHEVEQMQAIIDEEGGNFKLESWDWWYYAEKLRKQKYDLDESELKPYFKLENVRDGMFWVANQMYGISFTKLEGVPVYYDDVEAYQVKDSDGTQLGILYLDYFPRAGKDAGAWCTDFRPPVYRDGKRVSPIVSIVCNASKPTGDKPSLLSWDEVTTLFHEFGHGLHVLFSDGKYDITTGTGAVPNDYVELPSQVMENWAAEPQVIKHYGLHYETGEPIPDELIEKIRNSSHFNQGFVTVEYLAASYLDMDYHSLSPEDLPLDVLSFEKKSMDNIGLIEEILPRYRSTYFSHIFDGGYAAGYYVYLWAEQLDADAFEAFKQSGDIFNKDLAAKFRKYCLAESGEDEGMVQYRKFRGKDPDVSALLRKRGLLDVNN